VKSSCAERSGSMEEGDDGRAEGTRRVDPAPCTVDPREEDGGGGRAGGWGCLLHVARSASRARVSARSPWRGGADEAGGWCGGGGGRPRLNLAWTGKGRLRLDDIDNRNERSR
jgi:hypothetical protein